MQNKHTFDNSHTDKLFEQIQEHDVCCFDLFGVLLLRTVYDQDEFYLKIGEYLRDAYHQYSDMPPEVFMSLRIEAQKKAQKAAGALPHISLSDISNELRNFHNLDKYYGAAELCVLERVSYLNPHIHSLVAQCIDSSKHVVLYSDAPYTIDECKNLLTKLGFEDDLLGKVDILVCNQESFIECLINRKNGTDVSDIIYIGNRFIRNVTTVSYLSESSFPTPIQKMERNYFNVDLGELYDLRRLSALSVPADAETDEDIFWYQLGSSIYGPLLACFAHWVAEQAVQNKVKYILPFMREGELLKILLDEAIKERGADITVVPIYVSRHSVAAIDIDFSNPLYIKEFFVWPYLNINDLCRFLRIDIGNTPFTNLSDKTVYQCKQDGSLDIVEEYFSSDEVRRYLIRNADKQKNLLADYVKAVIGEEDAITTDIGYFGTIHRALVMAMKNSQQKNKLLFRSMMGTVRSLPLLLEGHDVRGWLGYGGENEDMLRQSHGRIQALEILMIANCGTTLGYIDENGIARPILDNSCISEPEKRSKKMFWQGLKTFQNHWFYLLRQKYNVVNIIFERKESFIQIHLRLAHMPLYQEAVYMGKLVHEDSFMGGNSPLCKPSDFELYNACSSPDEFLSLPVDYMKKCYTLWPEAVVVQKSPQYFILKYYKEQANKRFRQLINTFAENNLFGKRIAVWGAGKRGGRVVKWIIDAGIKMEFVIDNDNTVCGQCLYDVPIVSPDFSIGKTDAVIITPSGYQNEIRELIIMLHKNLPIPKMIDY